MKNGIFKRLTSWVLNVVMVISLFAVFEPYITQTVSARVNGTKNFSKSYSLGDNPGQNMVNIAKAQLGKNGGNLGYSTEEWCADFVIDCAILANQSNAIPNKDENAKCINLMTSIDKAGGDEVNAREAIAGDILFYGNSSRVTHVEIVYAQTGSNLNSLSTIGGNSGNSNNSLSQVKDHKTQSGMIPYKVFRPNYSSNVPPEPDPISKWYDNLSPVNLGDCFDAYMINTEAWKHLTVENSDNVIITSENKKAEQIWHFTRKSDGSYTIINCKTGKALDGGGTDNNVYTYASCDNGWQSWYIYGSSGAYYLKPQESDCVIDIQDGITNDGTNVHIYEYNQTYAQKFQINIIDGIGELGTIQDLGSEFTAYITNTTAKKHLTVEDNDNVMIASENKKAEQMWHFTLKSDGSYTIINCKTGKALDGGGTDDNVYTYDSCDNSWQSWYIFGSSGKYFLKSQGSNGIIDIQGGYTEEGTNVQLSKPNGTYAQSFQINIIDSIGELGTIKDLGNEFTAYIINTASKKHLTVEDNDNVIIASENKRVKQMWHFTRKSDGSYTIINCKTGKALDGGGTNDNVYTYASCGNGWQSWYIFGDSGKYILKSQGSNDIIDIQGGYTEEGTNVQLFKPNGTYAQKFEILKATLIGDCNMDGEFSVADVVLLQKWLLAVPDTELPNWQASDLCEDGKLDVFDLCLMKRILAENS